MSSEIAEFKQRLAEAIAWCLPRASLLDPHHSLRTASLRPAGMEEVEVSVNVGDPHERVTSWTDLEIFPKEVESLCHARAALLRSKNRYPPGPAADLAGGRLLIYYPAANVSEGWSGRQSRWFFDVNDTPPWDTWLWYVRERESPHNRSCDAYLVIWVPPPLLDLAEQGIQGSSMEDILWADWVEEPFIQRLRAEGLLGP